MTVKNRSYQNAWKRRSPGVADVLDGGKFYRPATRPRPAAPRARAFKRPGQGFVPLQGQQLDLFTEPQPSADTPLADLFPEAYEHVDQSAH